MSPGDRLPVRGPAHSSLRAVKKQTADGPQTVLDRATITIGEGERIGLVGRNGCGKSTFLRSAAGELAAGRRDVRAAARNVSTSAPPFLRLTLIASRRHL